jgi:beta-glucan synthesis-associated protein KRE6
MWPYSYDTCDLGTFPNQTASDGTPAAAATGSPTGGPLSYLPGQRLSACSCPGSDHPGPQSNSGRGVPEIDIIETQVDTAVFQGQVSQSFQTAPYNYKYQFVNTPPATQVYDSNTQLNTYTGGVFQQALSAVTYIDSADYDNQGYAPYGFEWWSDPSNRGDGYITWFSNGAKTWGITAAAVGPDPVSEVSQRLISEEPHVSQRLNTARISAHLQICFQYIVLNLGLSREHTLLLLAI